MPANTSTRSALLDIVVCLGLRLAPIYAAMSGSNGGCSKWFIERHARIHFPTSCQLLAMSHSLVCWRCGASLAELSLPLRRLEVCKACNAELHVCKMCIEYDTSYAKHCKEPTAEEVRKKDEANFCDHFKPKAGAYVAKDVAELARVKSALDDLFKK